MLNYSMQYEYSKLIRDLAAESGKDITVIQQMWTDAMQQAAFRRLWNPVKFKSQKKYEVALRIVRDNLGLN